MDTHPHSDTELQGSRLLLARIVWVLTVTLTLAVFAVSMPPYMVDFFGNISQFERDLAQLNLPNAFFTFYVIFFIALDLVVMLTFCAVAILIFWRKSDDWMAMFLSLTLVAFGAAVLSPVQIFATTDSVFAVAADFVLALGYGTFLILLYIFPDGRFVPRWTRALGIIWAIFVLSWPIFPAANPFGWSALPLLLTLIIGLGSGVAAQVYRYVRVASQTQRQQTKWVVFGLATPVVLTAVFNLPFLFFPASAFEQPSLPLIVYGIIAQPVGNLSLLILPVAVGISILRFRLWDIDLLINRTLVYGTLTGGLLVFYAGSVVLLQRLFRTLTGQTSDLAIVYSTLAITLLFMPLRRRTQDVIDRLFYRRRYDVAQTLTAFSEKVRDEVDLHKLTDDLLVVVEGTMQPARISLWLRQEAGESSAEAFHLHSTRGQAAAPDVEIAPDDSFLAYCRTVAGVVRLDRLDLESAALYDFRAVGVELSVPLVSQGELVGLLNLGPRLSQQEYSADDRRLLSNLATRVAPAIRVAQLVRQQQAEVRARERLEQELRVARLIQQTLLPDDVPALPGWQMATYYQPARAVGGDFYDFVRLADGRLGLIVGDVADKGMPAALMMASARSFLRAAVRRASSPSQVLEEVNELLCPDMPPNMFVTCFYAILDPASGRLEYANAGQTLPYQRVNGRVAELEATGVPLGVVPGTRYDEKATTLEPGESLLFYSDGLVEAHNPQRQMFSFPRLETLVAQHPGGTALIDHLLSELAMFTGTDWEQEDDVTLLALHRSGADEEAGVPQQPEDVVRTTT